MPGRYRTVLNRKRKKNVQKLPFSVCSASLGTVITQPQPPSTGLPTSTHAHARSRTSQRPQSRCNGTSMGQEAGKKGLNFAPHTPLPNPLHPPVLSILINSLSPTFVFWKGRDKIAGTWRKLNLRGAKEVGEEKEGRKGKRARC